MHKKFIPFIAAASLFASVALPIFAQSPSPTPSPTVNLACAQSAVEKRDNAIIAVVDTYHSAIKTALTTRRDALKAAWGIADETQRRTAIRNAWNAYKSTQRSAWNTARNAKNAAWRAFNTDIRACGPTTAAEDKTPSGVDAQL